MVNPKKAAKKVAKAVAKESKKIVRNQQMMSKIGRSIGGAIGGPEGQQIGGKAGALISKVFGHGDYTIMSNSLVHGLDGHAPSAGIPTFTPSGKGGLRVREREFLGEVTSGGTVVSGATTFSLASYAINPGLQTSFPWLSSIAAQFDQWEPNGILFEYRSTSSAYNGTSQALGTVIMATEYDVSDPAYASKVEMENSDYACSAASNHSLLHAVECDVSARERRLYAVRTGSVPATDVQRNFDLGIFQIATQGMSTAGVTLGELWVTYDITFYKKQLHANLGYAIDWTTITASSGVTSASWTGSGPVQKYEGVPLAINQTSTTQVNFAGSKALPGTAYLLTLEFGGVGLTATNLSSNPTTTGCTLTQIPLELFVSSTGSLVYQSYYLITSENFTINMTFAAAPFATGSALTFRMGFQQVNPHILL